MSAPRNVMDCLKLTTKNPTLGEALWSAALNNEDVELVFEAAGDEFQQHVRIHACEMHASMTGLEWMATLIPLKVG